jgi:hypothetical protein
LGPGSPQLNIDFTYLRTHHGDYSEAQPEQGPLLEMRAWGQRRHELPENPEGLTG